MNLNAIDVLLVEDSQYEADLTIRAFRKTNIVISLYHVKNGMDALDFVFAHGLFSERNILHKPKLILLDLKMPKVDGIAVLTKIKADERTKSIPVVILTSSKEDPDIKKCYSLGANSYIVKPVEFSVLQKSISELCNYWLKLNHNSL
jgi:two-component system response regulator